MRNQRDLFLGVEHSMFHGNSDSENSIDSEAREKLDFTLNNGSAKKTVNQSDIRQSIELVPGDIESNG